MFIQIPKDLKDFAVWLSPSNLKVFNKLEIISLAKKILSSKADKLDESVQDLIGEGLKNNVCDKGVFSLRVYFYQLFLNEKISLDLRPSRFYYENGWRFKGQNLAFRFDKKLQQALLNTYIIYYENHAEGLQQCLQEMGLIQNSWTEEEKRQLEIIFKNHSQQGNKTKQVFKLSDLMDSFSKIFFFIKEHDGKVPSEFSLLGVYLTSLYLTLNSIEQPLNVKSCFEHAYQLHKT